MYVGADGGGSLSSLVKSILTSTAHRPRGGGAHEEVADLDLARDPAEGAPIRPTSRRGARAPRSARWPRSSPGRARDRPRRRPLRAGDGPERQEPLRQRQPRPPRRGPGGHGEPQPAARAPALPRPARHRAAPAVAAPRARPAAGEAQAHERLLARPPRPRASRPRTGGPRPRRPRPRPPSRPGSPCRTAPFREAFPRHRLCDGGATQISCAYARAWGPCYENSIQVTIHFFFPKF